MIMRDGLLNEIGEANYNGIGNGIGNGKYINLFHLSQKNNKIRNAV